MRDPRVVQRGVLGVVVGLRLAPVLDLLRRQVGQRIDDGHAIAHLLAVVDHGQLDGLDAVTVDRAGLVGAHQIGAADHGHVFGDLQAFHAAALGDVAREITWQQLGLNRRLGGLDQIAADFGDALGDRAGAGLFDHGDQLAGLGDGLGDVLGAAPAEIDVVEGLFGGAHLDLEREAALGRRLARGGLDLDLDVLVRITLRHGRSATERPLTWRSATGRWPS